MIKFSHKTALLLSISASVFLSACTTTLASRTPVDIASNSWQYLDPVSGTSEVWGPSVNVLSGKRSAVSATAHLRTAGDFTDAQGRVLQGGAFLDVLMVYSTATPNPEDARMFDAVNWPGGAEAMLVDFGETIVDCREDVRETYIPNNYGYYGYGSGYGRYGRYGRRGRNNGHYGGGHRRRSGGYGPWGGRRGGHGSGDGHGTGGHGTGGQGSSGGHGTGGHGTGEHGGGTRPGSGTNRPTNRPTHRPTRGPFEDDVTRREMRYKGDRPPRRRRPSPTTRPAPHTPATNTGTPSRPAPIVGPRIVSRTRPAPKVSSPPPVNRPVSRPAPTQSYKPPAKPTRSKPKQSKSRRPVKVERFNRRNNPNKKLNYYPNDGYYDRGTTTISVSYRCMREESLRIFVPAERLDRAEETGLVLYLRPRIGREEVLDLPANYVSGFTLASSERGRGLAQRIAGLPPKSVTWDDNGKAIVAPKPASTPANEPSANTPIIYGEQ